MELETVQEITWIKQSVPWSYNQLYNITYILNGKKIITCANVYCNHRHLQKNLRLGPRNCPRNNMKNTISVMVLQWLHKIILLLLVAKSSTFQTLCISLYLCSEFTQYCWMVFYLHHFYSACQNAVYTIAALVPYTTVNRRLVKPQPHSYWTQIWFV